MHGDITHQFKRRKRLLFLKRVFVTTGVFMVLSVAVFYGSGRLFRLAGMEISGNERVSSADLENKIIDLKKELMNIKI